MSDWNQKIIDEFRANEGKVGGIFTGKPMVLLHHTGARTGTVRVNPLVYLPQDDRMVVAASKGGHPTNPDWYHNLKANPDVTLEVGTETFPAKAIEITDDDYNRTWAWFSTTMPQFAEYQAKTTRRIPLFALHRVG